MAIDTEGKRRSAIAAGVAALILLPVPDGTVGTQDRPHVGGLYAGITIGSPAIVALSDEWTITDVERALTVIDVARPMVVTDVDRALTVIGAP